MNRFKYIAILIMIIALSLSFAVACDPSVIELEVNYKIVLNGDSFYPGENYQLSIEASNNDDIIVGYVPPEDYYYEITGGGDFATINPSSGKLTINSTAPIGTQVTIRFTNGEDYAEYVITISKIEVESLEISPDSSTAVVNSNVQFYGYVVPTNATYPEIHYTILEGSEYSSFDNSSGTLIVNQDAVVDSVIKVQGEADGILSNVVEITVSYIPVTSVILSESGSRTEVSQGGTLNFDVDIYPNDASYKTAEYIIVSGAEFAEIDSSSGELTVFTSTPTDSEIVVKAVANNVDSNLITINVTQAVIDSVSLLTSRQSIEINGSAELSVNIYPYAVYGVDIEYEILDGSNYADIYEDGIITIKPLTPSGAIIQVQAYLVDSTGEVANSRSNIVEISVYKIDVVSVQLSSSDNLELVEANGVIDLAANVIPANATIQSAVYIITSGGNFASVDMYTGRLTVHKNNENGEVRVIAMVDGVSSNAITITTAMYYHTISNTSWSSFDNLGAIFQGYRNIKINLYDMPEDAALTTVVIPSSVKRLILEGSFSYISPVKTRNLFFYFYRASAIDITLINVGIEVTDYSAGVIFDLPENSNGIFNIVGDSYIVAGGTRNPYAYSVDGIYDPNDDNFLIRKHGMDGNNAANGGIAISGYNLEFKGSGSLYIKGGDGAHGAPGGKGADVPPGSPNGSISGNGGHGGSGGNAGYAIYGFNISINLAITGLINAYSGNAGRGGTGGSRGQTIVGSAFGENGPNGIDGKVVSAIAAYNNLNNNSGYAYQTQGSLSATGWVNNQTETILELYSKMERTYGIDMHIRNDLYSPYSQYPMTVLNNDEDILFMLRIIDNVLSKFPHNMFREIRNNSGKQVNLYVVNTISSGSIAGLASTANNVWLAHCRPNIRNFFYSDVENFAFHELMHIVKYNALSFFSENTIKSFNGSYNYVSTGSPTGGVYNPNLGFYKHNSHFLTSYSRRNWYEDICETFSIIARQGRDWDFMEPGTNIRGKMAYISSAIDNGYETCSHYKQEYWERFL